MSPWQKVRTRLFLTMIGMARRMTIGARAIILDGDKVFLIKHTYLPGWHFPGGGVEPGETALAAALREVREETGLEPAGEAEFFGFYFNNVTSDRDHVALYLVRDFTVAQPFQRNMEIADGGWFARDALPPDLAPGTDRRFNELFNGGPRGPHW